MVSQRLHQCTARWHAIWPRTGTEFFYMVLFVFDCLITRTVSTFSPDFELEHLLVQISTLVDTLLDLL